MARQPRQRSRSGFYHVMVRGNGRQVIFSNDADRRAFLRMLRTCLRDNDIELVAWCLMDNHAHLLVSDRDDAPELLDVHRFAHEWEKTASLGLRHGHTVIRPGNNGDSEATERTSLSCPKRSIPSSFVNEQSAWSATLSKTTLVPAAASSAASVTSSA